MPLPLRQAADALRIHPQTLRGWVRDGAPVVQRGSAGRGKAALYDVNAIKAWRTPATSPAPSLRVLAAEVPELVAAAVYASFTVIEGPHKRQCANVLAGAWFAITTTLLDHMRQSDATIGELESLPLKVSALREVFAQSDRVESASKMRIP